RSNGSSSTDTVLTMHAPNQDLTSFPTRRSSDLGITILGLALIRLMWRWANPTPPLPDTLRPYERALARFTHAALYFLLFAMPLSGWMMSSARGFPVSWFGFFQLPDLVPKSKPLYEALLTTHQS